MTDAAADLAQDARILAANLCAAIKRDSNPDVRLWAGDAVVLLGRLAAHIAPPDAGDEDPPEFAAYVAEIGKPDAAMTQADAERVAAAAVDEAIARRDTRTCGTAAQVALDAFEPGRWIFVTCNFDTHGNTAATVRRR
jgi:hypothetical protein